MCSTAFPGATRRDAAIDGFYFLTGSPTWWRNHGIVPCRIPYPAAAWMHVRDVIPVVHTSYDYYEPLDKNECRKSGGMGMKITCSRDELAAWPGASRALQVGNPPHLPTADALLSTFCALA
jgi:hypothetical protein